MNKSILVMLVSTIGGVALAIVLPVFFWPLSAYAETIMNFQTPIGVSLVTFAAAFTAFVMYRSASVPIQAEENRGLEEREERVRVGAAILAGALESIAVQMLEMLDAHNGMSIKPARDLVQIPKALDDIELMSTQRSDLAQRISVITAQARRYGKGKMETYDDVDEAMAIASALNVIVGIDEEE